MSIKVFKLKRNEKEKVETATTEGRGACTMKHLRRHSTKQPSEESHRKHQKRLIPDKNMLIAIEDPPNHQQVHTGGEVQPIRLSTKIREKGVGLHKGECKQLQCLSA